MGHARSRVVHQMNGVFSSGFPSPNKLRKFRIKSKTSSLESPVSLLLHEFSMMLIRLGLYRDAVCICCTEKTKSPTGVSEDLVCGEKEGGGAQAKGCLKSHYQLLSKFSIIIILMTLISLQFGAVIF